MNNKERFIKKATEKHGGQFDYSKVEYINAHTKVCIICPEHGEFWQAPANHIKYKGCRGCSHKDNPLRYNIKDLEAKLNIIHGHKYDFNLNSYKNVNSIISCHCKIHGDFNRKVASLLRGIGCPKCGKTHYDTNSFIEKAKIVHDNSYDYSRVKYIRSNIPITIICRKHDEFQQTPANHLFGQGCPKCWNEKISMSTNLFVDKAKEVHGDLYDYSKVKYVDYNTPVEIICKKHGVFTQKPKVHLLGAGCQMCHLKSQARVFKELTNYFTNILLEYSTDWIKPQRFDMYLKEYNIAIEYNGKQHYEPIGIFGGEEGFKNCQERDKRKMEKCLQNNCKLFIVRYDHEEEDIRYIINEINKIIKNYEDN